MDVKICCKVKHFNTKVTHLTTCFGTSAFFRTKRSQARPGVYLTSAPYRQSEVLRIKMIFLVFKQHTVRHIEIRNSTVCQCRVYHQKSSYLTKVLYFPGIFCKLQITTALTLLSGNYILTKSVYICLVASCYKN